jgi:hypothetical protein
MGDMGLHVMETYRIQNQQSFRFAQTNRHPAIYCITMGFGSEITTGNCPAKFEGNRRRPKVRIDMNIGWGLLDGSTLPKMAVKGSRFPCQFE